jgi:hypothetical protein
MTFVDGVAPMTLDRILVPASLAFATLWTASMYWWHAPMPVVSAVLLVIVGALAGIGWYWAMSLWMSVWMRRRFGRR